MPDFRKPVFSWGDIEGKEPPQDPWSERALLCCIFINPDCLIRAVEFVPDPDRFFDERNAAIYAAMLAILKRGAPGDIVRVHSHMHDAGTLESIGGIDYITEIAGGHALSSQVRYYAEAVDAKYKLRKTAEISAQAAYEAQNPEIFGGFDAIQERYMGSLDALRESSRPSEKPERFSATIKRTSDAFESGEKPYALSTGFRCLDDAFCGGFRPGDMVVMAGRPSMGKSALATAIAANVADRGEPVVLFSLEMGRQQIASRLVSAYSGVDSKISGSHGGLTPNEADRVRQAFAMLMEIPLFIDDRAGLTLTQLRSTLTHLRKTQDIKLAVVDYLQLMSSPDDKESRQTEVAALSRGIKAVARDFNIPVIAVAQLNRATEAREGHRPRLGDLRESGAIEQDADTVVLLHREGYYATEQWRREHPNEDRTLEVIIAKQRSGPVGEVRLNWYRNTGEFSE